MARIDTQLANLGRSDAAANKGVVTLSYLTANTVDPDQVVFPSEPGA